MSKVEEQQSGPFLVHTNSQSSSLPVCLETSRVHLSLVLVGPMEKRGQETQGCDICLCSLSLFSRCLKNVIVWEVSVVA